MDRHEHQDAPVSYETPAVENVLTPEEVEREVHYAGEATPADAAAG